MRQPILHGRTQSALDFVAHHRFADFVRYGKTHPNGPRECVDQNDVRLGQTPAVAVDIGKRAVFIQSVCLAKQLFAERRGRKILSALVAAARKHPSAALRFHSLTKTVDFALLTFFGLIRSFHVVSPIMRHTAA